MYKLLSRVLNTYTLKYAIKTMAPKLKNKKLSTLSKFLDISMLNNVNNIIKYKILNTVYTDILQQ